MSDNVSILDLVKQRPGGERLFSALRVAASPEESDDQLASATLSMLQTRPVPRTLSSVSVHLSDGTTQGIDAYWISGSDPSGEGMSRTELVQLVNDNKIEYLQFSCVGYRHVYPNANFYRIPDNEIGSFANSFAGGMFLTDHRSWSIFSRGGSLTQSRLENGVDVIITVRLTTQEHQLAFAEGKMDRFSVGWDYNDIICSITGKSIFSNEWSPWRNGDPYPGEIRVINGTEKTCEWIFIGAAGWEMSAVNRPAVQNTGVLHASNRNFAEAKMSGKTKNKAENSAEPQVEEGGGAATPAELSDNNDQPKVVVSNEQRNAVLSVLSEEGVLNTLAAALGIEDIEEFMSQLAEQTNQNTDEIARLDESDQEIVRAYGELSADVIGDPVLENVPVPRREVKRNKRTVTLPELKRTARDSGGDDVTPVTEQKPKKTAKTKTGKTRIRGRERGASFLAQMNRDNN